jgi:hypothetical protein
MTNWQMAIHETISSLATGEGADFGYAYVERLNTQTYEVQSFAPIEELEFDFDGALARLIEVADQKAPAHRTATA